MRSTLHQMDASPDILLSIVVTGMHLIEAYGSTISEIEKEHFRILGRVPVTLSGSGGSEMAIALSDQIRGFVEIWGETPPDLIMVLGDRGEALAAAVAAVHLNLHVVHLHGGERSGSVDESFRHCITKLAHYHCVATESSKGRLIKMGEVESHILVTGAPGLDDIRELYLMPLRQIAQRYSIDQSKAFQLVLFHPVVQQEGDLRAQMEVVLEAVLKTCDQPLIFMPNADGGGDEITAAIEQNVNIDSNHKVVHSPRHEFLSLLSHAEMLIGNSSSGIIEAASFSTPVINIGTRQKARERNANVIDVGVSVEEIVDAVKSVRSCKPYEECLNVYGDGYAGNRILDFVRTIDLDPLNLEKTNAY